MLAACGACGRAQPSTRRRQLSAYPRALIGYTRLLYATLPLADGRALPYSTLTVERSEVAHTLRKCRQPNMNSSALG